MKNECQNQQHDWPHRKRKVHESVPVFKDEEDENGNDQIFNRVHQKLNERRVSPILYDGVTPNPLATELPGGLPTAQPTWWPRWGIASALRHSQALGWLQPRAWLPDRGRTNVLFAGSGLALNYALQQYSMHYLIEKGLLSAAILLEPVHQMAG